jgi:hypothetical protein
MAAQAWELYNKAKKKIGLGTIVLGATNIFKIQLHTSASNASTLTLSTAASVDNQVANGNGYTTGGKSAGSPVWTVGASAKQYKFDTADVTWTASGGTIPNIKFAVVKTSSGQALCKSKLTTAQFTLASGNSLSIVMNSAGLFTMV